MVNYYEFKKNNPNFFEDVDLLYLMQIGDDGIISVPPYKEQSGRRLLIYRLGIYNFLTIIHIIYIDILPET